MFNAKERFIKRPIRRLKYLIERSKYKKPNYSQDHLFPVVQDLRKNGLVTVSNFQDQSIYARKLINEYKLIGDDKIYKQIKESKPTIKSSYKIRATSLFKDEDLLNFANDNFIIDNIEQYFGFKPYLREVSVVVDYKNYEINEPKLTQFFHRDSDDVKLTKVFMYLNDVNLNNGPFQFILKSHQKPWELANGYSDHEIRKKFGESNLFSATGPSGTLIFVDTNGLHRGLLLKEKYRIKVSTMYTSNKPRYGKLDNVVFK